MSGAGHVAVEPDALEATFKIEDRLFFVKLTTTDIQLKTVEQELVFRSQPFPQTNRTQLRQLFFESSIPDRVYYQPVCQYDPSEPVLLLPLKQNASNVLSCCSCQEEQSAFCNLCENGRKVLSLKDIITVHGNDDGNTSFTIWMIRRIKKHTWDYAKTVFKSSDTSVISQWLAKLKELLCQPAFKRPKSLVVFVNPISGKRKAVKIFHEKIAPLFHLANITFEVIQTQRRNHARDIVQTYKLDDVDGVVSVGGDGLFAEIVDGLITRTMKELGFDFITTDSILAQPRWTVGIIPAGSTDTVSCSTQGLNDPVTSALHIILGDCIAVDVGTVFHNKQLIRYNVSFFGYGYYGDCILDSEQNRWMGPKRYDWEGFKKVISNKSYSGEISFLLDSDKTNHPRDSTACNEGCTVCLTKTSELSEDRLSHSSANYSNEDVLMWQTVKGCFVAVNSFLISCRCRYAPDGPAPAAHLGNGSSDLVLVHDCSRLQYVRHLYRCTIPNADQFEFPFIQVFRITRFKFRPTADGDDDFPQEGQTEDVATLSSRRTSTSVWNCDGEVVDEPTVEYRVHPQVIKLFARGIEDYDKTESSCSSCLPFKNHVDPV